MKELTIEHLAPYLPYGLEMVGCQSKLSPSILDKFIDGDYDICPILRPLSDLTKEIEHNGERFIPIERIKESNYKLQQPPILYWFLRVDGKSVKTSYEGLSMLFKWPFDTEGLIEAGLAIDINTLNETK